MFRRLNLPVFTVHGLSEGILSVLSSSQLFSIVLGYYIPNCPVLSILFSFCPILQIPICRAVAAKPLPFSRGEGGPAQAGPEEERRNLKCWKRFVSWQSSIIFTRIPLQPQCAHWGSFPPGEAIGTVSASAINANLKYTFSYRAVMFAPIQCLGTSCLPVHTGKNPGA